MFANNGSTCSNSDINQIVSQIIAKYKLSETEVEITYPTKKGDNYMGYISLIKITCGTDSRVLSFIVKQAPKQKGLRQMMQIRKSFKREVYMYKAVLPMFKYLQTTNNCDGLFSNFPKSIHSCLEYMNEYIILEDMRSQGFVNRDKRSTLDYYHSKLVIEHLAKFHSLSFALKHHQPDRFKKICKVVVDNMKTVDNRDSMIAHLKTQSRKAVKAVSDEGVVKAFLDYIDNEADQMMLDLTEAKTYGDYTVVIHGDCWINNFLFKYGDESQPTIPTEVCFIDWQLSRNSSPIIDLSYFLYNSIGTELRDSSFDDLLDLYYSTLKTSLQRLHCDVQDLFPREAFNDHVQRFFKHGLHIACMAIHLFVSDSDEAPDFSNMCELDAESMNKWTFETKNVGQYNERMAGIIKHAVERGFI